MSIVKGATIPGYIGSDHRTLPRTRVSHGARRVTRSENRSSAIRERRWEWQTLVSEAYPVVGLVLIVSYVLWTLVAGDVLVDWPGPVPATE
ncbi:MAG TPA: hypothetical protein VHC22_02790 [Pirellulales bacterium]|nr:hypothetical protein [Pirellulales bacterium]